MDKRKYNGGNSTKTKGIDKRKNIFKDIFNNVLSQKDLEEVIWMLKNKAVKEEDVQAAKLLIEYTVGKPRETIDNNIQLNNLELKDLIKFDKS